MKNAINFCTAVATTISIFIFSVVFCLWLAIFVPSIIATVITNVDGDMCKQNISVTTRYRTLGKIAFPGIAIGCYISEWLLQEEEKKYCNFKDGKHVYQTYVLHPERNHTVGFGHKALYTREDK